MGNRILLVDDEADWIRTVGTFLKLAGYQVVTARGADEAVAQAQAVELGVIVLDVNLGGENAAQLLQVLKAIQPEAKVILYTGLEGDDRKVRQLLKQGAEYLQKGNLRDLLGRLQDLSRTSGFIESSPRLAAAGAWQVV